jgi:hypothetical protein
MQNITRILFLSCLKASELIEKKMHFKLSFREKLQLKIHKSMCDACRIYEKQSTVIEKGISMQKPKPAEDIDVEELKKKIQGLLELDREK